MSSTAPLMSLRALAIGLFAACTLAACGGGSDTPQPAAVTPALPAIAPNTVALDNPNASLTQVQAQSLRLRQQAVGGPVSTEGALAQVVGLQKVGEQRVSRTTFDYTFRVLLNSPLKGLMQARALLTETGAGTTIIDGTALFNVVPQGVATPSADTITLRHDRTQPFDLAALRWDVATYVAPTKPAFEVVASEAERDPAVLNGDTVLRSASPNPLLLSDATGSFGQVGSVFTFNGTVRRITAVGLGGDGQRQLVTEELPFIAAFKKLAYSARINALAEAAMLPASQTAVPQRTMARALAASRAVAQAAPIPVTQSALEAANLLDCVVPTGVAENEDGELSLRLEMDCSLKTVMAVFGQSWPDVGRISGHLQYTAKDEHRLNLEKGDDYLVTDVDLEHDLTLKLTAANLPLKEWEDSTGSRSCEKSDAGMVCTLPFLKPLVLHKIVPIAGVPVPVTFKLGLELVLEFQGNGGVHVFARSKRHTEKGIKQFQRVDIKPDPVGQKSQRPDRAGMAPTADFKAEAALVVQSELDIGALRLQALPPLSGKVGQTALVQARLGIGGYAQAQAVSTSNDNICLEADAGLKLATELGVFKSDWLADLGFDGVTLLEAEWRWPIQASKVSLPQDCSDTTDAKRMTVRYVVSGKKQHAYSHELSSVNRDVLQANGQWLQTLVGGTPLIIDFEPTVSGNPTFKDIVVQAKLSDGAAPNVTAVLKDGTGPRPSLELRFSEVPKNRRVMVEVKTFQQGKEARTAATKLIRIDFEPPLLASPKYEFRRDAQGAVSYRVTTGFEGDSRLRTRLAVIERVNLAQEPTSKTLELVGDNQTAYLVAPEQTLPAEVNLGHELDAARPQSLLLESALTEQIEAVYRMPIERDDKVRVDTIEFDRPTHRVLQPVKISVRGGNLPPDIQLQAPWCGNLEEVDYNLEVRRAGFYSNTERHFTCTAVKIGATLEVSVLAGAKTVSHAVEGPFGYPGIATDASPVVQGQEVALSLAWDNNVNLFQSQIVKAVWDFGQGVVSGLVALYESVKHTFTEAGDRLVKVVFYALGSAFDFATYTVPVVAGSASPTVSDVSPLTATAGVPQTYTVTGTGMVDGSIGLALAECEGITPLSGGTPERRQFTCTFPAGTAPGLKDGAVGRAADLGNPFATPLKTFQVSVLAAPQASDTLEGAFTNGPTPVAPWSFGWQLSGASTLNAYEKFTAAGTRSDLPALAIWNRSEGPSETQVYPWVIKNTAQAAADYGWVKFPAQAVVVTPGAFGERALFRWTANSTGTYEVHARFTLLQEGSVEVLVQKNGVNVFVDNLERFGKLSSTAIQTVNVTAGDVIDFVVSNAINRNYSDMTRVEASVSKFVPPAQPYTKISNAGLELPDTALLGDAATDWGCTRDNTTGAVWEVKRSNGPQAYNRSFTFYTSTQEAQKLVDGVYSAPTEAEIQAPDNAATYIATTRSQRLCGRTNWDMGIPPGMAAGYAPPAEFFGPSEGGWWTGGVGYPCPYGGCSAPQSAYGGYAALPYSPCYYGCYAPRNGKAGVWLVARPQ